MNWRQPHITATRPVKTGHILYVVSSSAKEKHIIFFKWKNAQAPTILFPFFYSELSNGKIKDIAKRLENAARASVVSAGD